jgi:hypothetical protein
MAERKKGHKGTVSTLRYNRQRRRIKKGLEKPIEYTTTVEEAALALVM